MRLCDSTVARASARLPGYDRELSGIGIVHLGIGAFHRAHQAVYTDSVLGKHGGNWAIRGVSLRGTRVRDALKPQDCLYTLAQRAASGTALRVIGAVRDILVGPEDRHAVLAALVDPAIRIVSLTVTEKGYCHDPANGTLSFGHPDIAADLENPEEPRSAIGLIVRALAARKSAAKGRAGHPLTVMSCDNLPANGETVRGLVIAFAEAVDGALALWIADHVSFPSTMVDRIVPATTDALRQEVSEQLGVEDTWPVVAEPFSQWVIEDEFCAGRPAWDDCGATFVADVAPHELMKLRLLNGSHSTLAYLGYLSGYELIDEAMKDKMLVRFVRRMMDEEISPTLVAPKGIDLEAYKETLLQRFDNPTLGHRTYQIAMDGSQKLPQRILGSVRDQLNAGRSVALLAVAIAGWIRYAMGVDGQGHKIDVMDPLAASFAAINESAGRDAERLARGYLALRQVFGRDLASAQPLATGVTEALQKMLADGVSATVAGALAN